MKRAEFTESHGQVSAQQNENSTYRTPPNACGINVRDSEFYRELFFLHSKLPTFVASLQET